MSIPMAPLAFDSLSIEVTVLSLLVKNECELTVESGFVNERRKEEDPSNNDADKNFTSNVMLTTTDSR